MEMEISPYEGVSMQPARGCVTVHGQELTSALALTNSL